MLKSSIFTAYFIAFAAFFYFSLNESRKISRFIDKKNHLRFSDQILNTQDQGCIYSRKK